MKRKRERHKKITLKQQKQQKAEHKNKFFKRIQSICSLLNCPQIYNLIPREELEVIYNHRFRAFRFIAAEGNEIPQNVLSEIRAQCTEQLRETYINISDNDEKMSLFEFYTMGVSVFQYVYYLEESKYKNASLVKELKNHCKDYNYLLEEAGNALEKLSDVVCFLHGDVALKIYWIMHEFNVDKNNPNGIENLMKIHCSIPEKIYDDKDNNYRPATRISVGLSQRGIGYFAFKLEEKEILLTNNKSGMGIFIQAHALHRLKERLDCLNPILFQAFLISSILEGKIYKDENGTYLISFNVQEIKIGYLIADLNNGNLIIRTFLFITQNGTPEGKKLAELYGLCKQDKTYLELDKLSTFVTKDMCDDKRLSDIFQQVGCQYLLDLAVDNRFKGMCNINSKTTSVKEIVKYLRLDENKTGSNLQQIA